MNNHNKVIEKSILFYRGTYHYDELQWTYQNAYEVHTTFKTQGIVWVYGSFAYTIWRNG